MKLVIAGSSQPKPSYLKAIESDLNNQNTGKTELYAINSGANNTPWLAQVNLSDSILFSTYIILFYRWGVHKIVRII